MMTSDINHSPTCFQSSFPQVLDLIKMDNGSPLSAHNNLVRSLSEEAEKNIHKAPLDLELKQHRQSLTSLTNIESR